MDAAYGDQPVDETIVWTYDDTGRYPVPEGDVDGGQLPNFDFVVEKKPFYETAEPAENEIRWTRGEYSDQIKEDRDNRNWWTLPNFDFVVEKK
jgi:hypothetical protein